jgi:hypothetical protein
MPHGDPEIRCDQHDRPMSLVANVPVRAFADDEPRWTIYQCLVPGCTRYYSESLGGYLTRSEKGTLVPILREKSIVQVDTTAQAKTATTP